MRAPDPEARLAEDILFLACTRPALVAGVPMEAMAINIMASATAFLAGRSLLWLLVAPALHLVLAALCRHEPNAFRLLRGWIDTRGRARNTALWGGSSATPLPLARSPRGGRAHA